MKDVVGALRIRLEQSRRSNAPLETWRELQLEILTAARELQRKTLQPKVQSTSVCEELWTLLGESFWIERSVERLVPMVEQAIAVLDAAVRAHET